jgi:hypothetical protein
MFLNLLSKIKTYITPFFQKYFSAAKETKHLFQPESKEEVVYVLEVENIADFEEKVILYGSNWSRGMVNNGNSGNIKVASVFGEKEINHGVRAGRDYVEDEAKITKITKEEIYGMMVSDTGNNPIFVNKIIVHVEKMEDADYINSLAMKRVEIKPTGHFTYYPILFNPPFGFQNEYQPRYRKEAIVDFEINGNTFLAFMLKPKTKIKIWLLGTYFGIK